MKVPPKRKGNNLTLLAQGLCLLASMKALPKRKGNVDPRAGGLSKPRASMKALPRRKGNGEDVLTLQAGRGASMKVPTKEEGKSQRRQPSAFPCSSLDEGPYGKVGNDICNQTAPVPFASSMKVPRKGREFIGRATAALLVTPASMKTLPKRKGNPGRSPKPRHRHASIKVPTKKGREMKNATVQMSR